MTAPVLGSFLPLGVHSQCPSADLMRSVSQCRPDESYHAVTPPTCLIAFGVALHFTILTAGPTWAVKHVDF
jgi:hypothetical protein